LDPKKETINAGGPAVAPFVTDTEFSGGSTVTNNPGAVDTSLVTNPAPTAVYQSERYGNFSYTIPGLIAGGAYTVRLHFTEDWDTAAGQRLENVTINGTSVLTNFDIFASAGAQHKAIAKAFNATANGNGQIVIAFAPTAASIDQAAKVDGIVVTPSATDTTPPTVPTNLTATVISSTQINLSWTASTDPDSPVAGYKIFRNGTQVGTSATASYSGTGLAASTVYSYTVSAYDAAGNNSAQSGAVNAITNVGTSALSIGDRLQTIAPLNVRATASITGTKLGTQSVGALGTIVSGPTSANGYTWWKINYDTGADGWSIAPYLSKIYPGGPIGVGMTQPSFQLSSSVQEIVDSLWQKAQDLFAQIHILQAVAS